MVKVQVSEPAFTLPSTAGKCGRADSAFTFEIPVVALKSARVKCADAKGTSTPSGSAPTTA